MTVFLDTNVLLRLASPTDPAHATAAAAVATLRGAGDTLWTVPQNLFEFWVVATRPVANNGLGLTTAECTAEIVRIKARFPVILDSPALLAAWGRLVAPHDFKGKVAHHARIVAPMLLYRVPHLFALNPPASVRVHALTLL